MNWITKFENGVLRVEKFFNELNFIPRLLSALKVGTRAFADEFLKDNQQRKKEIEKRNAENEQQ